MVEERGRAAVWLWGEHDLATVRIVTTALAAAVAVEDVPVVVDLSDVDFMDASTLSSLMNGRKLLAGRGRRLTVRSPQPFSRRLLELCDLAGLVEADVPSARDPRAPTALQSWIAVPASDGRSVPA